MKSIYEIDRNFFVINEINKPDVVFRNCLSAPFQISGIYYEDGKFRRLPEDTAAAVSGKVHFLHANTAGGRLRFRTDSSYVAITTKMENICRMPHFALTGSAGFDLHTDDGTVRRYVSTFHPPYDMEDGYKSVVELGSKKMREITIHFPLYSDVKELLIGLEQDAVLEAPAPYRNIKPIVYYGSSITQGGCASRPGNAYQNIITRANNIDHINLGFSGSAKAEDAMAAYIKDLEMSLFVYDYDHNSPSPEYLAETHEKMFKTIRAQQPKLPILLLSRPRIYLDDGDRGRLAVIETTYRNALAAGDRNVYFIKGSDLMAETGNDGTVDGIHPNDYGFHAMARVLLKHINEILGV